MSQLKYRPEIDGLRAVAIILVLLFHFDLGVTGGFIGVDVFFVISGYLITSLILKEQERGEFRLSQFWARRIRRIYPASFMMVIATIAFSFWLLLPEDFEELAKSAISQQLMASNVFFWRKSGYFAGAADFKPLLHTWSLSVEEQFYLIYPAILLVLQRVRRPTALTVLLMLTISSFALGAWGVYSKPGATFFLLPTRAWEMLIGGMICYFPSPSLDRRWRNESLSLVGASLIICTALAYDASTVFPGANALLPCAGAVLLIISNSSELTYIGRLLASRPVVAIGLISYSLYLWHWPVLVLMKHYFISEGVGIRLRLIALSLSTVLAVLTYFCVEVPIRRRSLFADNKRLQIAFGGSAISVVAFSLLIINLNGIPKRFNPLALSYAASKHDRTFLSEVKPNDLVRGAIPQFGAEGEPVECMIIGDSHAMALVSGLDAACKARHISGFQITHSSTAPLLGFVKVSKYGLNGESPEFNRRAVDLAIQKEVKVVFLAAMWSLYSSEPGFEESLQVTIRELRNAGIHVAIIKDVAHPQRDVPLLLCNAVCRGVAVSSIGVSVNDYLRTNQGVAGAFDRCAEDGVSILNPLQYFVDNSDVWRVEFGGESLYRDGSHLSSRGSLRLTPMFNEFLERLQSQPRISGTQLPKSVLTRRDEVSGHRELPSNKKPQKVSRSTQ